MSFDAWKDANVVPSRDRIVIVAPKSTFKSEVISSRLKGQLLHPNKPQWLSRIAWSHDSNRVIAGDFRSGVIQVWEAASGRLLSRFEVGSGYRSTSDLFQVSHDGKTIFVGRCKQKQSRIELDGKEVMRWDYSGDIRAWDLESGSLRETYQPAEPRGINMVSLSPDGTTLLSRERLSNEGKEEEAMGLWDVKTRHYRQLPGRSNSYGKFSPDNKIVAISVNDDDIYTKEIRFFQTADLKIIGSIPIKEKFSHVGMSAFSPDGRSIVGVYENHTEKHKRDPWDGGLKAWDVSTGREVACIPTGEKNSGYLHPVVSPDGRTMATVNWQGSKPKLLIFDRGEIRLTRSVELGEKATIHQPAFSPDGKWIAVATQVISDEQQRDPSPEDAPQPRIHLIEASTGTIREILISPPGIISTVCFSPDGKTLATDGHGKVLLWDMTKPIGGESAK